MKKHSLTILLLSLFSVFFSQEMSRIKVDLNKLDFNTKLSEISSDYVDGNLIYFQNKKAIKKYSEFYDLFMLDSSSLASSKGDRKKVSLTKQLTIVTDYHEGPCFVDEENDRIYITISSLDKKGMKREKKLNNLNKNRLRIVEGDFKNGIISNLKEFEHNNPIYNVGHASYSKFTKRLYFISTMPGTIGGSDIFYSVKKTDGSWGKPINVGRRINSGGSELFPYAKNGILFFTSNGQKNQVGQDLDIYFIKESELTTKNPTALVGANSSYDDYAVCFNNNEGEYEGFFTSNRDNKFSGNDDVYGFKITNVEYSKTYDLLVNVTNNDKLLRTGQLTLMNSEGEELETVGIKKEGFNLKALEKGKEYQLAYSNSDFSRIFDLPINYYSSFVAESFDIETDAIFKDTLLVDNIDVLVNKLDSTEKIVAKVEPNVKVISNPEIITNLDPKVSVIENPQVVAKVEPNVKVIEDPEVIAKVEPKVLLKVEDKIPLKKDPIKPKVVDPLIIADTAILDAVKAKEEVEINKEVKKTEVIKFDRKETFENIYFAFDNFTIYKYSQNKLDKLVSYLKQSKAKYVILNAYTDARGTSTYNERLSVKRALSTRDYLIKSGINESMIKYQGFGEKNLVNRCGNGVKCKDTDHLKNRRIEFTIAY